MIAELRGQIAKLDTLLLGRLLAGGEARPGADGDRLLDVDEAAAKLGLSRDALYRNEYPFVVKIGNRRRFSEKGIKSYSRPDGILSYLGAIHLKERHPDERSGA